MFQLALLPAALLAAQPPALERVIVSANRQPQTLGNTLSAVELIDREAITRSQARDIAELLRTRAGIDVARNGGPGQQTSLFLRGSNSNHVLVLIDGVRVASSNTGAYTFEQLPLAHIDHIEIVRGPRAALYGSDAIGGVIHIHTRSGPGTQALLSYGSDEDAEIAVGHGIGDERSSLYLSVSRRDRGGYSAQNPDGFSYDPDDDGVVSNRFQLNGQYAFSDAVRASLSALGVDSTIEFDQGRSGMDDQQLAFALDHQISTDWSQHLQLSHARQDLDTPAFDQRFKSTREQVEWSHALRLDGGRQLGFGVNVLRDKGSNASLSSAEVFYGGRRDSYGGYLNFGQRWLDWSLDASARLDHYDGFGTRGTGQIALGRHFEQGLVYASAGQGFRAPNLNELYSPGFGGLFAGNPDLEPERSNTLELGARWAWTPAVVLEGQVYRSRIQQLIAFQGGQTFQAINIRRARVKGAELGLNIEQGPWQHRLSASWTEPLDLDTGERLLRRSRHQFALESDVQLTDELSIGGELSHHGARPDFGTTLERYTLFTLRARYALSTQWALELRGENLGDERYALASGFNTADRGFQLSLRYGD